VNESTYPRYRASGVPWVPKIPDGWHVARNGRLFGQRVETGYPDLPILEVSLRTGVQVRDMEHGKRKQVMSQKDGYKRAVKGDIAYNMMRMWQGALGTAPVDGLVSPAYVVIKPFAETNSVYYSYLFRTRAYMREVNKFSRGIVPDRNRLYWESFKQMPTLAPPRSEQDQIAHYLRTQDAKIARFIRIKRELIARLNEQKLRLIDHAVTGGLDTSTQRKPSGVAWLGNVPGHWEVLRLKRVCRFIYGEALGEESRCSGDVLVFGSNGKVGKHNAANACGPCIVIGRKGSFGKVNYSEYDVFVIDTAFYVDGHCTKANIRWLYYLLLWCRLDNLSKDSAVPGLHREDAYNAFIPFCDIQEQEQIAAYLDKKTTQIDAAIAQSEQEITLIREYRERLIQDAVTGQIDLRGWQPSADDLTFDDSLAALADEDAADAPEDARDEDN